MCVLTPVVVACTPHDRHGPGCGYVDAAPVPSRPDTITDEMLRAANVHHGDSCSYCTSAADIDCPTAAVLDALADAQPAADRCPYIVGHPDSTQHCSLAANQGPDLSEAAEAIESLRNSMATTSRDMALDRMDAWCYGIILGWRSCDDLLAGDALSEVAERHGWSEADAARNHRLHHALDRVLADREGGT